MPSNRAPWLLLATLVLAGCSAGDPISPDPATDTPFTRKTESAPLPGATLPPVQPRYDGGNYIGSGVRSLLPRTVVAPDTLKFST